MLSATKSRHITSRNTKSCLTKANDDLVRSSDHNLVEACPHSIAVIFNGCPILTTSCNCISFPFTLNPPDPTPNISHRSRLIIIHHTTRHSPPRNCMQRLRRRAHTVILQEVPKRINAVGARAKLHTSAAFSQTVRKSETYGTSTSSGASKCAGNSSRAESDGRANARGRCNDSGALEEVAVAGLHSEYNGLGDFVVFTACEGVWGGGGEGCEGEGGESGETHFVWVLREGGMGGMQRDSGNGNEVKGWAVEWCWSGGG
jgi:hypothetical protein